MRRPARCGLKLAASLSYRDSECQEWLPVRRHTSTILASRPHVTVSFKFSVRVTAQALRRLVPRAQPGAIEPPAAGARRRGSGTDGGHRASASVTVQCTD